MNFINKLLGRERYPSGASKDVAKERLQLVLAYDRVKLPPALMQTIRDEIIDVISKYIEINAAEIEISLTREEGHSCLVANIPVLGTRSQAK